MHPTKEGELEELREQNHRLKLSLETTKQLHLNELEYLKDELQIKDKECKKLEDALRAQSRKQSAEGDIASLNSVHDAVVEENIRLKSQLQQLQHTLDQLKSAQVDRQGLHDENEALKVQNDRLNIEISNTRELLEIHQAKALDLTQQVIQNAAKNEDLQQELDTRDGYIAELQSRIKEVEQDKQEAIMELQQAQMLQQNVRQECEDPTRRGNSLFSEVDERRVRVEEELSKLRERIVNLTSKNRELTNRAEQVKSRNAMIVRQFQVMEKNEIDVVKELKKLESETIPTFNHFRDKLLALKNEYKRKLMQYRDGVYPPVVGEVEALRDERDLLFSQKIGIEQENWDLRKELKYTNSKLIDMESRCVIYRTKLLALQEGMKAVACGSGEGAGRGLDTSLNGSMLQNGNISDDNGNKKWFRDTDLNTTECPASRQHNDPSSPDLSKRRPNAGRVTAAQPPAVDQEIPGCNQQ